MNPVDLHIEGAIARLRFNRPEQLNALDVPTATAFVSACRHLAGDPTVRAVVVSGAGRSFGVGGDLATLHDNPQTNAAMLIDAMHEGLTLLSELDAPVIAQLQGAVAGGSMSLALGCDWRVAASNVRLNMAYAKVGTSCDVGASWALPRLVGPNKALEIALLCDPIDSAEALRLGLVNRVVGEDHLDDTVNELAHRLAAGPTRAYGELKRLMRGSHSHSLTEQLAAERAAFLRCANTRDFSAACDAFLSKRPIHFEGH